jgi:FixJ family two-component response regulator
VIVITGQDTAESQERAMKGGAVAYLEKPLDGEALIAAITEAVASVK